YTGYDLYLFGKRAEFPPDIWNARPTVIELPLPADMDNRLRTRLDASLHNLEYWLSLAKITPLNVIASPPPICGEVGCNLKGVIVNHDTAAYQERLTLMYHLGLFRFLESRIAEQGRVRILEIGGGYGALAYYIKKLVPKAAYTICDLPESLCMSALYLSLAQ